MIILAVHLVFYTTMIILPYFFCMFNFRYAQHGSYPVIRPYNESFPEHFYLNRTNLHHVSVQTNNYSVPLSINNPLPGHWFLAAFIPKGQEKIAQKVMYTCTFYMGVC